MSRRIQDTPAAAQVCIWVRMLVAGEFDGGLDMRYPREVLPIVSSSLSFHSTIFFSCQLFCNNDRTCVTLGAWLHTDSMQNFTTAVTNQLKNDVQLLVLRLTDRATSA